jgi:hypothetical protein
LPEFVLQWPSEAEKALQEDSPCHYPRHSRSDGRYNVALFGRTGAPITLAKQKPTTGLAVAGFDLTELTPLSCAGGPKPVKT